jgi:hypothetical protein
MTGGYVALLDVLGFSSIVSGEGEERLRAYLDCLENALGADPPLDYVVFSDSIVLTSGNDSDVGLQSLIQGCSKALGLMLEKDIPLRGAIAHGPYFRSTTPAGVFIAGRAIIDAYRFETAQDWVGIMLAPSAVRSVPNLEQRCSIGDFATTERALEAASHLPWSAFVQPCPSIPFHVASALEEENFEGFAIVPTDGTMEVRAVRDSLLRSLSNLQRLKSLAPDPKAQAKYKRAHSWLNYIGSLWSNAASWVERDPSRGRLTPGGA